jgi:arylsulfatase A-like enzyme
LAKPPSLARPEPAEAQLSQGLGKKFFVVCGYRRPHIPWHMPQRFFDMYNDKEIKLSKHQDIGTNVSTLGYTQCGFSSPIEYKGAKVNYGPHNPLPVALQQTYRQGYYASVSWLDFQIGRLMAAVDALELTASTAVALFGDHGWKLGEHSAWSKQDIWETGSRVPLLFRTPWIEASVGAHTFALAETVDMYRTLADLALLPPPPDSEGVQGTSLAPVIRDPSVKHVKQLALTQFPRCGIDKQDPWTTGQDYACMEIERTNFDVMGYAARSGDWRYIEWRRWNKSTLLADWTEEGLLASGLYDHRNDTQIMGADYFDLLADFVNLVGSTAVAKEESAMKSALTAAYAPGAPHPH